MPKILPIKIHPDPTLRQISSPVDPADISSFPELCRDMIRTMKEKDGIGLAAPQIGKNIRLIVINQDNGPVCLVNPELTKRSFAKEWGEEGCLSLPDTFGQVRRHKKVRCLFWDNKGKKRQLEATGITARVLQHEIDHLDGILFIDKAVHVKKTASAEDK